MQTMVKQQEVWWPATAVSWQGGEGEGDGIFICAMIVFQLFFDHQMLFQRLDSNSSTVKLAVLKHRLPFLIYIYILMCFHITVISFTKRFYSAI